MVIFMLGQCYTIFHTVLRVQPCLVLWLICMIYSSITKEELTNIRQGWTRRRRIKFYLARRCPKLLGYLYASEDTSLYFFDFAPIKGFKLSVQLGYLECKERFQMIEYNLTIKAPAVIEKSHCGYNTNLNVSIDWNCKSKMLVGGMGFGEMSLSVASTLILTPYMQAKTQQVILYSLKSVSLAAEKVRVAGKNLPAMAAIPSGSFTATENGKTAVENGPKSASFSGHSKGNVAANSGVVGSKNGKNSATDDFTISAGDKGVPMNTSLPSKPASNCTNIADFPH